MSKHLFPPIVALLALSVLAGCNSSPSDNAAAKSDVGKTITASELASAKNADGVCALDTVDDIENAKSWTVKKSAISMVRGWASTSGKKMPTQFTIVLTAQQAYGFAGKTGEPRPDVAQALGSADLANSGYNFAVDFSNIPTGTYHAFALTSSATGNEICNFQREIVVTP
ncbi:hypothetical protein ELE36_16545 [Pseudolysobacter antarcticus]|uniref:Lipoprotein n=1 Tax=Pseudolysobacter antarcticus TaxID=2511995 RepID=A0A411HMY5_9GAMM|nr:hypothetical protein [Pseudolysobacter antarcticus]QBB71834.1 hypothetical protein ELE36_16545 [Pseudolysobacter antarcticus]